MEVVMSILPLAAGESAASLANGYADKAEAFSRRYSAELEKRERDIAISLDQLGEKSVARRQELLRDARSKLKREFQNNSDLVALRQEVDGLEGGARERFTAAAQFYGDPNKLGEIASIDDPKRAHYASVVRGAGHAALLTLYETARADRNLPLAMALAQEVQPLPHNKRPFDPAALIRETLPESAKKRANFFTVALEKRRVIFQAGAPF